MDHGITGEQGLSAAYLKYQLESDGCPALFRCTGRYRLTGWSIYDGRPAPEQNQLWIAAEDRCPTPLPSGVFWCITNWTGAQPVESDGLFICPEIDFAQVVNLIQRIFRDYEKWEFAMDREDLSLDDLLEISLPVLRMPMTIVDSRFQILARNSLYKWVLEHSVVEQPVDDGLIWTKEFQSCTGRRGIFRYRMESKDLLCYNFTMDGKFVARLLASIEEPPYAALQEILLERLVKCLEPRFSHAIFPHSPDSRDFYEAVETLLSGHPLADPSVLRRNRWMQEDTYQIAVIRFGPYFPIEEGEQYLLRQLRIIFPESCILRRNDDFLCVRNLNVQKDVEESFRERMSVFLREHVAKAGISNCFIGRAGFASYLQQAYDALRLGEKADPHFWCYYFKDYTFAYLLGQCTAKYGSLQVASPKLGLLRRYDVEHNTELFQTLRVYLATWCNATDAARQLYIHRTSLLKRLRRIIELTELNLSDPDTVLYLLLSYKLLDGQ